MKPESKRVSKTHTYAHGSNSKLKKNCFDFTKLSKALNAAQEKGSVGAVVDNINDASSPSANTIYDFSKLLEVVHGIQDEKKNRWESERSLIINNEPRIKEFPKLTQCFDWTALTAAVYDAKEKGTVGEVVGNINDASSSPSSANSTYDFSELLEVVHGIQEEKKNKYHTNRATSHTTCGIAFNARKIAETTIFVWSKEFNWVNQFEASQGLFLDLVVQIMSKPRVSELFATTGWFIWSHHSKTRLQENSLPLRKIGDEACKFLQLFLASRDKSRTIKQSRSRKWLPPKPGEYKLNFNGAMFTEGEDTDLRIVVRNSAGQILASMAEKIKKTTFNGMLGDASSEKGCDFCKRTWFTAGSL
ncbi:hypothetical protein SO802_009329 [Lithocarpus litseifolius]|uniref:Uncharacterized protein n=1 Tax=Lithocarpus litseifolius TaxID=425828 RepID=A0AAW2DBM3_9ROSI